MPINVFGNSSNNSENKIDTSLFVQKPFLTIYIESIIEEDIDMENQFGIKSLPDPIGIREPASKLYVDNKFNDPPMIKNTAHVDFIDKNLDNVRFVKVSSSPAVAEHLTAKYYVDQAVSNSVHETTLIRNNEDSNFDKFGLTNINSNTSNTEAIHDALVITKSYVDQFYQENERPRRDLGIDFFNESSDLVIK